MGLFDTIDVKMETMTPKEAKIAKENVRLRNAIREALRHLAASKPALATKVLSAVLEEPK